MDYIKNTKSFRLPKHEGLEAEWVERTMLDKSNRNVILIIESDGVSIGLLQLSSIDWVSRTCYFGIAICDENYLGKGISKVASNLMFNYAFNTLNLRKITCEILAFNEKSIQAYTKLGFKLEGNLEQHYFWDGAYHDLHLYSLFAIDFNK